MVEVHYRWLAVRAGQLDVVEPVIALLQLPVGDDRLRLVRGAVPVGLDARRVADRRGRLLFARDPDLGRKPEHAPNVTAPWAGADHKQLGVNRARGRLDRVDEAVVEVDARDFDSFEDADALRAREAREVLDRLHRLRPAALPFVE